MVGDFAIGRGSPRGARLSVRSCSPRAATRRCSWPRPTRCAAGDGALRPCLRRHDAFGVLLIGFVAEHLGVRVARGFSGGCGLAAMVARPLSKRSWRIAHQDRVRDARRRPIMRIIAAPCRRPIRSRLRSGRVRRAASTCGASGSRWPSCASSARAAARADLGEDLVVFRDAPGRSACRTWTAPTADVARVRHPRSSAVSGAAITAGRTTSTAAAWRRPASRPAAGCCERAVPGCRSDHESNGPVSRTSGRLDRRRAVSRSTTATSVAGLWS